MPAANFCWTLGSNDLKSSRMILSRRLMSSSHRLLFMDASGDVGCANVREERKMKEIVMNFMIEGWVMTRGVAQETKNAVSSGMSDRVFGWVG